VQNKDITLDHDAAFHMLLKQAGADPVMRTIQDTFFERMYFIPACKSAESMGLTTALGHAVAYDSEIQGGWARLSAKLASVKASGGEAAWLAQYLELRRAWLLAAHAPLPATAYRVDTLAALLAAGNQELNLPFTVHGVALTADNL
jgi:chitosanase